LPPMRYASLLLKNINKYNVTCWMVNTGWVRGQYGIGERISLHYTRFLINKAIEGDLEKYPVVKDPRFGFSIVTKCPGIPSEVMIPSSHWADINQYNAQADMLCKRFVENLKNIGDVPEEIIASGPH